MRFKNIQPKQQQPPEVIQIGPFPHGLNTVLPPDRIAMSEASELVNWTIRQDGSLVSRYPVKKYSTVAVAGNAEIKHIAYANIGGTNYVLIQDENHILYYLDGDLEPVVIGTLEGEATIMSFKGVALIMDGSYLKYLDSVSAIKMAYDAGTGTRAFQFDWSALANDTYLALGNGTNLGIAQKFTTQAWTAGYTIPPATVTAYLSEEGAAPAGAVTVSIRSFADPSVVLATGTMVADASGIGATATEYSHTFVAAEITTELSPETDYLVTLEYDAGDAANYVKVHCNNIATGGLAYEGDTDLDVIGNWNADTAKHCLMSVSPTRPPKAKFGTIWNYRPWIGGDPDNPGLAWLGNLGYLDWSTPSGGGYVPIVDDSPVNYEIGGMAAFYGSLFVFGKQAQPYLVRISGTEPDDYAQVTLFHKPWTTHKGLVPAVNDIWFTGHDGVSTLSGVQEYGDLRAFFASDPVQDRFLKYWDADDAVAGYFAPDGQYWVAFPNYHRVMVCHTKQGKPGPDGGIIRYPWAESEFYREDLSDTATYKWTPAYELYQGSEERSAWVTASSSIEGRVAGLAFNGTAAGAHDCWHSELANLGVAQQYNPQLNINFQTPVTITQFRFKSGLFVDKNGYNYSPQDFALYGADRDDFSGMELLHEEILYPNVSAGEWSEWITLSNPTLFKRLKMFFSAAWAGKTGRGSTYYVVIAELEFRVTASPTEYYLEAAAGGDPGIESKPDFVTLDGENISEGTIASLNNPQWDYGLDPSGTFNTIYLRDDTGDPATTEVEIRAIFRPTAMCDAGGAFLLGGSDGYVYRVDLDGYNDMEKIQTYPRLAGPYIEIPFAHAMFTDFQLMASGKGGGIFPISFYVDGLYGSTAATAETLHGMRDNLTVQEYIMQVQDMFGPISYTTPPLFEYISFIGRSLMVRINNVRVGGYPVYFNGIIIRYRRLGY